MGRFVFVCTLLALLAGPVRAAELSLEQRQQLRELQSLALTALEEDRFDSARDFAKQVLALDDGLPTLPARFVLVEALLGLDEITEGLAQVEGLLALPLFDKDRERASGLRDQLRTRQKALSEKAERARERSGGRDRGTRRVQAPKGTSTVRLSRRARQDRGLGVALLAGGVVPAALGGALVGADLRWASEGVESGGWAAIGIPALAGGVALTVAGGFLLDRSTKGKKRTSAASEPVLVWVAPGPVFGVAGRF